MEPKGETQWSSIIVLSVQEMVKEKIITTVPPRYVQSGVVEDSDLLTEIPIIDMKQLCSFTSMDSDSEVQKLNLACNEFGFFQAQSPTSLFYKIIRPQELIKLGNLKLATS